MLYKYGGRLMLGYRKPVHSLLKSDYLQATTVNLSDTKPIEPITDFTASQMSSCVSGSTTLIKSISAGPDQCGQFINYQCRPWLI